MSYGILSRQGDEWLVEGLPPHVALRFKTFFRRVPKTHVGRIRLRNTPDTCSDLLWFMQRYPLTMSGQAKAALDAGHTEQQRRTKTAAHILSDEWQPSPVAGFREGRAPYPFQARAAELIAETGRLLVFDDVGLGKTVTALAAICRTRRLPAAIIVQAHLAEQWLEEYVRPFTTLTARIIEGTTPYPLASADLYIFKYSNIAGWVDYAAQGLFRTVVFDEIQELRRGIETQKGKAAAVFAAAADIRIGLTATPVYNYGSEIWRIVEVIDPGALGSWHEFLIEWCAPIGGNWRVKEPDVLGSHLRELGLAVRRTERDVGGEMPPVNTLLHHIDWDAAAVADFEAEARALALKVLEGRFVERGQAARELDMMARQATGVAKAAGVAAMVRLLVESGEKVLLAGWHRDVYEVWLKALADYAPVMITGSETAKQKNASKAAFINGDSNVLLISLRSGSGIDGLQNVCSKVVFGELDWSPQVHKQVIGRLRRPGQLRPVDAIHAITNGGSDPVIVELLGLKADQSRGILDPGGEIEPVTRDDSRIRRLAESFLRRAAE